MKNKRLPIVLYDKHLDFLNSEKKRTGYSKNKIIRDALEYLEAKVKLSKGVIDEEIININKRDEID